MITVQHPRPGTAARSKKAMTTALRTLRHVQDEQLLMWEAFYRTSTWDTRPQIPAQPTAPPSQAPSATASTHQAA